MTVITAFDTLPSDLKAQVVLIQRTIPSVQAATTDWWAIPRPPFTLFMNNTPDITPDYSRAGSGYRLDTFSLLMRAVWGSLASGGRGETEKRCNDNMYAVLNRFDKSPHLNHPTTNAKFQYIAPKTAARITRVNTRAVRGDDSNPAELYLVTDYILTVTLIVTAGQKYS